MRIEFLGTGGAVEPELGNTSVLIDSDTKLLIDCGFEVPRAIVSRNYPVDYIDAIYFTHTHADHTFGFPAYMIYAVYSQRRTKPLTIIGQPGVEQFLREITELAYSNVLAEASFELEFIETTAPLSFREFELSFAVTDHPRTNYAIRLEVGGDVIAYSGDGGLTEESRALLQDARVLIHEAYFYDQLSPVHESALGVLAFAEQCPHLEHLALVHVEYRERRQKKALFESLGEGRSFRVHIPEPGSVIER